MQPTWLVAAASPCTRLASVILACPCYPPTPLSRQGVLRMGQEIEVRPGIITKDASGAVKCIPIFSRIVSLFAEQNELQFAVPGGLIGVGLTVSRGLVIPCGTQYELRDMD